MTGLKLDIRGGNEATIVNQMNTAIGSNVAGMAVTIPEGGLNKVGWDGRAKNIAVNRLGTNGATGQGAA